MVLRLHTSSIFCMNRSCSANIFTLYNHPPLSKCEVLLIHRTKSHITPRYTVQSHLWDNPKCKPYLGLQDMAEWVDVLVSCHVMSFHGIYFKDCHDHMSYSRSCRGYRVDIAYVLVCGGWIMVYELLLWEITIHVHHGLVISHDMYWLVNESGPWEKCVAYVLTVYDRRGSPFTLHHSSAGRVLESHAFIPPIVQIRPARLGKRYIM